VEGLTKSGCAIARETVAAETPAWRATSSNLVRRLMPIGFPPEIYFSHITIRRHPVQTEKSS
jgi:hypothetical protein